MATWRKESPTARGWYWWRQNLHLEVIAIIEASSGLIVSWNGMNIPLREWQSAQEAGEWCPCLPPDDSKILVDRAEWLELVTERYREHACDCEWCLYEGPSEHCAEGSRFYGAIIGAK